MPIGTVKWFDVKKGFGFIESPQGGKDIFVHYTAVEGEGFKTLHDGDKVEFEVTDSDRGPQATRVKVLELKTPKPAE